MKFRDLVSIYLNSKYRPYHRTLVEATAIDDNTEVYVYNMKYGISRFMLTLTATDGNIDEVIT